MVSHLANPVSIQRDLQSDRLHLQHFASPQAEDCSGQDVLEGLTRHPIKTIPAQYFYDDRGSQLFEQICTLPEYYPTRTEISILASSSAAIAQAIGPCEVVELGSGNSSKIRHLLNAQQTLNFPLRYLPLDVSGSILKDSALGLLADYPSLTIAGVVATYELGLAHLPPLQLPKRIICFFGSTLGNLTPDQCDRFFKLIHRSLKPGEYFLLGVDLQKSTPILEAAYNDSQGITAAFNLNMLQHLNWRFQGNFCLENFSHRAIYNPQAQQIEMYLDSRTDQRATLSALGLEIELAQGEAILTEISRKFDLASLRQDLTAAGLPPQQIWQDPQGWFALILCQARSLTRRG
ncbi:L-histidine N(alpha)-methyltransferase [Candidatus Synechococcus calcipolaris G9]|uniref:L-histidine N(Alpha)-methyltransferase n=1 Tax=Candidatus Synechococcus calcipolaris G9 TaxID=1497997 RepID=A0ABT6EZL8_9SYNE|nr:L-histidine N(alpha)-methyltransferase [Candidatus Synechococcus calcipolaris]MDG2991020.1 L-histidine N(alpha)-methyltransferase [Candidatus Synechococcus calcipolaris G9]